MATLYSDLYGTPPNAISTTPVYKGPHGHMAKGTVYAVRGVVTIASSLGAGDKAALCLVPEGARLEYMAILPSADLDSGNTFTFNLGWTSAATTHASAATGLQGTSAYVLLADALISAAAAAARGDQLELARAAGSLSAGSLTFYARFAQL